MQKNIRFITQTAMLLALLLVLQWVTKPLGQYVTGTAVNLVLVVGALSAGFWGGLTLAVISPLLAFFLGIAPPFFQFVPFIALGNAVYIAIIFLANRLPLKQLSPKTAQYVKAGAGVAVGAMTKFFVLYLGIVVLLIPLLALPAAQVKAFSAAFGIMQLFTAVSGGILAFVIWPLIQKALGAHQKTAR